MYALAYGTPYVLAHGRTPAFNFFRFCRPRPTMRRISQVYLAAENLNVRVTVTKVLLMHRLGSVLLFSKLHKIVFEYFVSEMVFRR